MLAGGGLLFAGLTNLIYTPSPLWMWALGLAVFLPMAWLGYRLAPKRMLKPVADEPWHIFFNHNWRFSGLCQKIEHRLCKRLVGPFCFDHFL